MPGIVEASSGGAGTDSATSSSNRGTVCDDCEHSAASCHCEDCDMLYCDACWSDMHSVGKLASHQKLPLPQTPQCSKCSSADAIVDCSDCGAVYCQQCDDAVHRKGRLKLHKRDQLSRTPAGSDTLAAPVKTCDKCGTAPAEAVCLECGINCCVGCDKAIHSRGKLAKHLRQRLHLSFVAPAHTKPSEVVPNTLSSQQNTATSAHQPLSAATDEPSNTLATVHTAQNTRESAHGGMVQHVVSANDQLSVASDLPAPEMSTADPSVKNGATAKPSSATSASYSLQQSLSSSAISVTNAQPTLPAYDVAPLLCLSFDTQDTGTLTQKVLVVDKTIQHLATKFGKGHTLASAWPSDEGLQQHYVTTVGLYGNKGKMAAWLRDRKVLDPPSLKRLMDDSLPGVYCLSNESPVQYLVFRPTQDAFTEMSRKNISCNMVRYLLELCDEVLVFFAEPDLHTFHSMPFGSQRIEKRTQKMVMSFQKESEEDIFLRGGFQVALSDSALRSCSNVAVCHGAHVRCLHRGEDIPRRVHMSGPQYRGGMSYKDAERLLEEKRENVRVTFGSRLPDLVVLKLCRAAVPDLKCKVQEYDDKVKAMEQTLQEELDSQIKQCETNRVTHRKHIEQAVAHYIAQAFPLVAYFFPDTALQKKFPVAPETSSCPVCLSDFTNPKVLSCEHAFCEQCVVEHARVNGKTLDNGLVEVSCPQCRDIHDLNLDTLPGASRAQVLVWEQEKRDVLEFQTLLEVRNMAKISMEYIEHLLEDDKKKRGHWARHQNIVSILKTPTANLEAMEYALAVYSLAEKNGLIEGSQLPYNKRLSKFVATAGRQGRSHVQRFTDNKCIQGWRVWKTQLFSQAAFDNLVKEQTCRFQADLHREVFQNAGCKDVAGNHREAMIQLLIEHFPLDAKTTDQLRRDSRDRLQMQTRSILSDTVEHLKEHLVSSSDTELKMVIEQVHINEHNVSLTFKEQHQSDVKHVRQLYTFDPLKSELDKMEDTPDYIATPQFQRSSANLPLDESKQRLMRLYHLKTGKLLAIVQHSLHDSARVVTDVHLVKAANNSQGRGLKSTNFSLRRDVIDLVDFDEDTRMVAFHAPQQKRVDVYRFDPDWKQWSLRCNVELERHKGDAPLTQLVFVPGQEKLCLVDATGQCHIYDVQDKLMKKRTVSINTRVDRAMATLDGSFLLIFHISVRGPPKTQLTSNPAVEVDASTSTAASPNAVTVETCDSDVESMTGSGLEAGSGTSEDSDGALSAADMSEMEEEPSALSEPEQEEEPKELMVVMDIYSLVNLEIIKSIPLDPCVISSGCLDSLRLVLIGKQMHLVALSQDSGMLCSLVLDIRSARSVFNMTDLERSSRPSQVRPEERALKHSNYLDYLFFVYDKFSIEDCLGTSRRLIHLSCILDTTVDGKYGQSCDEYVDNLFRYLESSTHKPMHDFKCSTKSLTYEASLQRDFDERTLSMSEWLQRVICLVPIQIARAEQNSLTLFADGLKSEAALAAHTVVDLQDSIQLGLYEAILDDWSGPVKVISSMGKQSTGKSYMLNHLTGSLFDISGDRCTDGVWLTLRLGVDCLYVVLDFEGLGSMERTEQEDMFLSVMNAAISGLTVFKTEYRVDQDTRNMLSRFRDGVELIKGDDRLLRGWFYINIKDVDKRDIKDLQNHFRRKLEDICKEDENNFLTKMYRGQLAVQTFPTLGNQEFYVELDAIRHHLQSAVTPSFKSGREFREVLKLLMAKIHMQEWSSFDRTAVAIKVDRLRRHLEVALQCGCILNHNGEVEPLVMANGEAVGDVSLVLDSGEDIPSYLDSGVVLAGPKEKRLINDLALVFAKAYRKRRDVEDANDWTACFQQFLHAVCDRRSQRIKAWVQSHVGDYDEDGDVRILRSEVKSSLSRLRQEWTLCGDKCSKCFFKCLLRKYHENSEHNCLGDHRCHMSCSYCAAESPAEATLGPPAGLPARGHIAGSDNDECVMEFDCDNEGASNGESSEAAIDITSSIQCRDQAGHAGKHDCKIRKHTCGQTCHLYGKDNCNHSCVKKVGHDKEPDDGEHLCNAVQHLCGAPCSLPGCANKCISPYEMSHERHACRDLACPKTCTMKGCNKKCQEVNDHFHAMVCTSADAVEHYCGDEHVCPEECSIDGICDIVSERKIEEKRFRTSAGDEFSYQSVTDQNGTRKKCCIVVPPNEAQHAGSHRCTPLDKDKIHFCDRRCPSCGYFCTLRYNHDEDLHATDHGNMRLTHVAVAGDVFVVDNRRYGQGDSGEAEMCNFHCKSLGRGHIHLMLCESQAPNSAQCTVSVADGIRHETTRYGPDEDIAKDELTHAAFWKAIRFQDPCTPEDKELFKLCSVQCGSEEHQQATGDEQPTQSFCTQKMWHDRFTQSDLSRLGNVGHVHSEGHHFKCTHSGSGPLHHILVVDRSGSMSGGDAQPSDTRLKTSHNNRLGAVIDACNQYLEMRHGKSSNDLVSFVAFESSAQTIFKGLPLDPTSLFERMRSVRTQGGTNFSPVSTVITGNV